MADTEPAPSERRFGPPGNLLLAGLAAWFGALAILTAFGSGEPWIVGPCAYLSGVLQVIAVARAAR